MNSIGDRIKEIRNDHHLNQDKFGEKIGLKKSGLSLIETNQRNITDSVFNNIVNEFCVNVPWLKDGIGPKYNEDKKKQKELLQNEYLLTNFLLKDDILSLLEKMKDLDIDENMEIDTALQAIVNIFNYPLDKQQQFSYFEAVSSLLLDIQRFIESLQKIQDSDPNKTAEILITKYTNLISNSLTNISSIFLPNLKSKYEKEPNIENLLIASSQLLEEGTDITFDKLYNSPVPVEEFAQTFGRVFRVVLKETIEHNRDTTPIPELDENIDIIANNVINIFQRINQKNNNDPLDKHTEEKYSEKDIELIEHFKQLSNDDQEDIQLLLKAKLDRQKKVKKGSSSSYLPGEDENAITVELA